MKIRTKLVLFWLLLVVCMILHFNYHISGIVYGINVVAENANGKEPSQLLIVRSLFYHLPILLILCIMYSYKVWLSLVLFIISLLYFIAHGMHFVGTLSREKGNFSQLSLLLLVLVLSGFLAVEHYRYYKLVKHTKQ